MWNENSTESFTAQAHYTYVILPKCRLSSKSFTDFFQNPSKPPQTALFWNTLFFIIGIYRHSLQNNIIRTEYSQSSFQEMGKPQRYQAAVNECIAQDMFISRNAERREYRRSSWGCSIGMEVFLKARHPQRVFFCRNTLGLWFTNHRDDKRECYEGLLNLKVIIPTR